MICDIILSIEKEVMNLDFEEIKRILNECDSKLRSLGDSL